MPLVVLWSGYNSVQRKAQRMLCTTVGVMIRHTCERGLVSVTISPATAAPKFQVILMRANRILKLQLLTPTVVVFLPNRRQRTAALAIGSRMLAFR